MINKEQLKDEIKSAFHDERLQQEKIRFRTYSILRFDSAFKRDEIFILKHFYPGQNNK